MGMFASPLPVQGCRVVRRAVAKRCRSRQAPVQGCQQLRVMCPCSSRYDVARIKICASSSTTRMTAMAAKWTREATRLAGHQCPPSPGPRRNLRWPIKVMSMYLNVSLGAPLRAVLRYEAQIKAIDILPRGRENPARLAHADGYVDSLLCHNSRFRAAPRPRFVVIPRRELRRGLLRGPRRSVEASIFHAQIQS